MTGNFNIYNNSSENLSIIYFTFQCIYIYIYLKIVCLPTVKPFFQSLWQKEKINKFTSLSYHQNESRSATDTSDALKNV